MRFHKFPILISVLIAILVGSSSTSYAQKKSSGSKAKTMQTSRSRKSSAKASSQGKPKSSSKAGAKKGSSKKGNNRKPATSAEAKRQQELARREIARTKEEIRRNEQEVKKGLSELNRLSADIAVGKGLVAKASDQVAQLNTQISALETDITQSEAQLTKMREDYLRSVKKIRAKRNSNSTLAFIFSSKNFSQALRRMRYLRQLSKWKEDKSRQIEASVKELTLQKALLEQSRIDKDRALARQVEAQEKLNTRYRQQDEVVSKLKRNGQALNSHLAKKQQEANALKSTIASLIAEETRKAEEARRAEEARKAEEALKAEEARKAEAERLLAMQEQKASGSGQDIGKSGKKADKKSDRKVDKSKDDKKKSSNKDYAETRKRKPRSQSPTAGSAATSKASPDVDKKSSAKATTSQAGNFAAMRGSLPRPVSGAFRVTSQFGRHSLPELPDVVYDNPGIDAETSAGASAQAVYGGKVSGVYVIPGFSTVVIVNHGNYYTVYGNIASPAVKVGDVVKQGQALGKLAAAEDDSSHSAIHFEVWKNRDKLNPLEWIR